MTQVNLTLLVYLTVIVGLTTACYEPESSFSSNTYSGPINRCASVGECTPGNLCDDDLEICVYGGADLTPKHFYVKVNPQATDEIPNQVFEIDLPTEGTEPVVLQVQEPVDVPLVIKTLDEDGIGLLWNLDFLVEITRIETQGIMVDVPGASPIVSVHMVPHQSAQPDPSDPLDEGFVIRLLPGSVEQRKYNFKITPQDGTNWQFPPKYYDGVIVTDEGELVYNGLNLGSLDVSKASEDEENKEFVSGTVRRGDEGVEYLAVVARDSETGRLISTQSVTTSSGYFKIGLPPGIGEFTLVASKPNTSWYPSIEMDYDTGSDLVNVSISGDVLDPPVRYFATFEKGDSYGVSDCLVIFEYAYDDENGNRSYASRSAYTSVAGEASVYLYPTQEPEEYSVTVIPPPSGDLAQHELDVFYGQYAISANSDEGDTYLLEQRSHIQGRVLTKDELELVPAGLIRAYPVKDLPLYARASSASVESSGDFHVWVDTGDLDDTNDPDDPETIGEYRFVVEAPSESWYAWGSYTQHSDNAEFVDFELPIPYANMLELELASGSEDSADILKGSIIEVYEDVEGQLIMVGRSVADQDARVAVLLEP